MTTVPGLYALGEANFSDHGANRLGASALMQGLADGYFVVPYTVGDYLAGLLGQSPVSTDDPVFTAAESGVARRDRPLDARRRHQVGRPLPPRARQDRVGQLRHGPRRDRAREGPHRDPGPPRGVPQERAGARRPRRRQPVAREGRPGRRLLRARRADVLATLSPARSPAAATSGSSTRPTRARPSATTRTSPTSAAWEWQGRGAPQELHKEPLDFEYVKPDPAQLQVARDPDGAEPMNLTLKVWRQDGPGRRRTLRDLPGARHQRRHVVPRDARRRQRAPHRGRARSPSRSTATAARASAARAA